MPVGAGGLLSRMPFFDQMTLIAHLHFLTRSLSLLLLVVDAFLCFLLSAISSIYRETERKTPRFDPFRLDLLINFTSMEKPAIAKSKIKFLMLLPKVAAALKLPKHPFSPGKMNANKLKSHQSQSKVFSGPITSVVFEEARSKSKNSSFERKEPTSPKISCMGQIKHKKKMTSKNKNNISLNKEMNPYSSVTEYSRNKPSTLKSSVFSPTETRNKKSTSRNIFNRAKPGRNSDASAEKSKLPDRAPTLSQMKRFASGRDNFSKFDWTTAQVAPDDADNRRYYSDEERRDSEEEEDDEVIIPFSAPILLGEVEPAALPLEPRKEINLWKRRTMAKPKPLQLSSMVTS